MKHLQVSKKRRQSGVALLMVMIVVVLSAFILGGALQWVSSNSRMNERNNEYYRAVAAAEAATEKAISVISRDFRDRDSAYVASHMDDYRAGLPTTAESAHWSDWVFSDPAGSTNGIYVNRDTTEQNVQLDSQYTGLMGFAANYSIIANARQATSLNGNITVGVRQEFQLATIPVFQFAIFYGITMEIFPGPTFNVIGRVHSNDDIYYGSNSGLNFRTHVTSVGDMHNAYLAEDSNHSGGAGSNVNFLGEVDERTSYLQLPIGTNNTPTAIREILMPPPSGESATSAMGVQRYYNKSDLIVTVENSGVTVTSGRANSFATVLSTNEWQRFISTTNAFKDWREAKTVLPVDINVAALRTWSATNGTISTLLSGDVSSIYVDDKRTMGSTELAAVRVYNGSQLPDKGLTVSTARPLYVQGDYNQPINAHLGTTNTSGTKPASFAADAISVLSGSWNDANSTSSSLATRVASHTTVNAAFLSGIVQTQDSNRAGNKYSGGVENYPRMLEKWGGRTLTYNGSMVVMFSSQYATNGWTYGGSVYQAPTRNWTFDLNFLNPDRLPPGTPRLSATIRGSWAVISAGNTNIVY